jgi:hypothetical protein
MASLPVATLTNPALWRQTFFEGHGVYGFAAVGDAARVVVGVTAALLRFPGVEGSYLGYWQESEGSPRLLLLAFMAIEVVVLAVPILWMAIDGRRIPRDVPRLFSLAMLGQFVVFAAFNWWWEPSYIKYWVVPLVAWWGLVAAFLGAAPPGPTATRRTVCAALVVGAIATSTTLAAWDRSRPGSNPWLAAAAAMKDTRPSSLFVSTGHPVDFCVTYFARRNVITPELIAYGHAGDQAVVKRTLSAHVRNHLAAGGPLYAIADPRKPLHPAIEEFLVRVSNGRRIRVWTWPGLEVYLLWEGPPSGGHAGTAGQMRTRPYRSVTPRPDPPSIPQARAETAHLAN